MTTPTSNLPHKFTVGRNWLVMLSIVPLAFVLGVATRFLRSHLEGRPIGNLELAIGIITPALTILGAYLFGRQYKGRPRIKGTTFRDELSSKWVGVGNVSLWLLHNEGMPSERIDFSCEESGGLPSTVYSSQKHYPLFKEWLNTYTADRKRVVSASTGQDNVQCLYSGPMPFNECWFLDSTKWIFFGALASGPVGAYLSRLMFGDGTSLLEVLAHWLEFVLCGIMFFALLLVVLMGAAFQPRFREFIVLDNERFLGDGLLYDVDQVTGIEAVKRKPHLIRVISKTRRPLTIDTRMPGAQRAVEWLQSRSKLVVYAPFVQE